MGTLELKASFCEKISGSYLQQPACKKIRCPCVADVRVFEVVSELLAEGWVKAASHLANADRGELRFEG